jgi:3-deoxy-D-arabino-heptulosonate 7-phosphate (DAHP) synthase class II
MAEMHDLEIRSQKEIERTAMNLLMYNTTIAARLAQGHGIDKETVAMVLEDLAHAVRTGDCAERMHALSDDHTLIELVC